jgi:hypothetical protein
MSDAKIPVQHCTVLRNELRWERRSSHRNMKLVTHESVTKIRTVFQAFMFWFYKQSDESVYMRVIGSVKSSTFMASGMTDALSPPSPPSPRPDDPRQPERRVRHAGIVSAATYRFVLCAALNSCNLGYDIGVSTEASRLLQADLGLSNRQREIFIGSINFWASYVLLRE